jgi:hypothetical protein
MNYPLCKVQLNKGTTITEIELYEHINCASECRYVNPICPECGKEFFYDGKSGGRPWRRLAAHLMRFGYLKGEEHAIVATMEGEPPLPSYQD